MLKYINYINYSLSLFHQSTKKNNLNAITNSQIFNEKERNESGSWDLITHFENTFMVQRVQKNLVYFHTLHHESIF